MAQKFASLLAVLHDGELLAAETAQRQAELAPQAWMKCELALQARQERGHVRLVRMAQALSNSESALTTSPLLPLRTRLALDLNAGNLGSSIAGLHGVLEHLGEALLEQLAQHAHPADRLLHRLRRHVLAQEQSHIRLGARCLQRLPSVSQHVIAEYYNIGHTLARDVAGRLADARLDGDAFWRDVSTRLDAWHRSCAP